MRKAVLAALVAFMAIGTTSLRADPAAHAQIAQIKSALQLTPAQERHWPPVEAALRALIREAASSDGQESYYQRAKAKASSVATSAAAIRRVVSAARPLVRLLDEGQKQTARSFAAAYGGASLASAL